MLQVRSPASQAYCCLECEWAERQRHLRNTRKDESVEEKSWSDSGGFLNKGVSKQLTEAVLQSERGCSVPAQPGDRGTGDADLAEILRRVYRNEIQVGKIKQILVMREGMD